MLDRYSRPEMRAIWSDQSKIDKWLQVEVAVVQAWAREGVVPVADAEHIKERAFASPEEVSRREETIRHDLAAFVDVVAERCGAAGRWFHFGLTSSDVLDTALALQLREANTLIRREAVRYFNSLKARALDHVKTACVGRTHGIHAEPTTFGAKLASHAFEALRFIERFDAASEEVRVGKIAGAVGTYSTVPPHLEAAVLGELGLKPESAPTQIVARDRLAFYLGALSLGAAAVERFALEVRHLQRTEVAEVEEAFTETQKGSSAMPHKRNPVGAERLCGLARVLRSAHNAAEENVALWHERDISHSSVERVMLPLATATLHFMLSEAASLAANMKVFSEQMMSNLELTQGLVYSQRLLLALVRSGLERDRAYRAVQAAAIRASETRKPFIDTALEDPDITDVLSSEQVRECFNLDSALSNLSVIFDRLRDAQPPPSPD
ncbi:MAG: adenylosuccinate lyase [Acidimicrobiia bacterium]